MTIPDVWSEIVKELPIVALIAGAAYIVLRYAAGLLDKLLSRLAEAQAVGQVQATETQKQILAVVDRNTDGWRGATTALAGLAEGLTNLVNLERERALGQAAQQRDIASIRVMLATRPCISEAAVPPDDDADADGPMATPVAASGNRRQPGKRK